MSDPTRLADLTFSALTERMASSDPVPGGGSAAALAGAMGAALVTMVAALTLGRPEYAEHEATLVELRSGALARRERLLELAEEDATAYQSVVNARRLPKDSDAERAARAAALRDAMADAADVPLRTAIIAAEVLELAERIAPIGNRNAVSDAGVAALLAAGAVRSALLNVRINLPYLPDGDPLRRTATSETIRLEAFASEHEKAALSAVDARLAPS